MAFTEFINRLEERLTGNLPGKKVQQHMLPRVLADDKIYSPSPDKSKKGGVLILLYPDQEKLFFPLMQRPDYEGVHGGQISLPGGKMEAGDASLIATAVRETEEEIGVKARDIHVIGELTELHISASNIIVSPVVAYTRQKPQFIPNPYEVEEIIEADLAHLLDDSFIKTKEIRARGGKVLCPYFDVQGNVVWGATAMILSEFLHVVKESKHNK